MPVYEYVCCGITKSDVRSITEKEVVPKCSECKKAMVRVFSAPTVTFMGIGWGKDA